jgi:chemotaxis protein MotA
LNLGTIVGLVVAIICIFAAALVEAGHEGPAAMVRLLNFPGALIVFGGTIGATMTCFSLKDFLKVGQYLGVAFKETKTEAPGLIAQMVQFAEVARKEGLLKLEELVSTVENTFLRKGIQLIVDGTDPAVTREILENEVNCMEERHKVGVQLFQQAGGFAPTMGMIGTVMGLVNVLANLNDTASLGPAISTAFIATFYGVFTANILWLPLATKLKALNKQEVEICQIIIEGVSSIQAGDHPRVINDKLVAFLSPSKRELPQVEAAGGAVGVDNG